MLTVACDNCGTIAAAALADWLELRRANEPEPFHFCTWNCLGAFQVKRERESAVNNGERKDG